MLNLRHAERGISGMTSKITAASFVCNAAIDEFRESHNQRYVRRRETRGIIKFATEPLFLGDESPVTEMLRVFSGDSF